METLDHPLKEEIERIRTLILGSSEHLTEHIKWNAPSFCYQGDDRVTFKLYPRDRIQLVFHRGARVKDSEGFSFEDSTGLLQWVARDRALVTFHDMQDVEAKQTALAQVVTRWVESTS